jgi:hypothetical protein
MSSATGKDRQRKLYFSAASYAALTFLTTVECRLTLPYHLQNAKLHSLPFALTVPQLMFVDNTGHGRRRGI